MNSSPPNNCLLKPGVAFSVLIAGKSTFGKEKLQNCGDSITFADD